MSKWSVVCWPMPLGPITTCKCDPSNVNVFGMSTNLQLFCIVFSCQSLSLDYDFVTMSRTAPTCFARPRHCCRILCPVATFTAVDLLSDISAYSLQKNELLVALQVGVLNKWNVSLVVICIATTNRDAHWSHCTTLPCGQWHLWVAAGNGTRSPHRQ